MIKQNVKFLLCLRDSIYLQIYECYIMHITNLSLITLAIIFCIFVFQRNLSNFDYSINFFIVDAWIFKT